MSSWHPAPPNPQISHSGPLPDSQPHLAPSLGHAFMGRQQSSACASYVQPTVLQGRLLVAGDWCHPKLQCLWSRLLGSVGPRLKGDGHTVICDFYRSPWAQLWQKSALTWQGQLAPSHASLRPTDKLPPVGPLLGSNPNPVLLGPWIQQQTTALGSCSLCVASTSQQRLSVVGLKFCPNLKYFINRFQA